LITSCGKQFGKALGKEVVIFEHTKNADVDNYVCGTGNLLVKSFAFVLFNENSAQITAECGKCYEQQELPAPATIEIVACSHYKEVLPLPLLKDKPIENEYYWQENEIL
jgi:hypothetical protein